MKIHTRILTLLVCVATLLATGCKKEVPGYKGSGNETGNSEYGYLETSSLIMQVIADSDMEAYPDGSRAAATRADIDTEQFLVRIVGADETEQFSGTFAELKALSRLELFAGVYEVEVRSEDRAADTPAAFEDPYYSGSKSVTVRKGETSQIGEVICTLANIKVTVMISADLAEDLTDDTQTIVSLDMQSLVFAKGEDRAGYFTPTADKNTLKVQLKGAFADTQEPVQFSKEIQNVSAGQWRKLTLVIAHSDEGGISFDIIVESFVQDDEITINGTQGLWEPIYTEKPLIEAPSIEWTGHDLSQPFQLKASMFDGYNCTESFQFQVKAPGNIAAYEVEITSTNAAYTQWLTTSQVPVPFDLCQIDAAHAAAATLRDFGFPLSDAVKGQSELTFDLAGAMTPIYKVYGDGTYTFRMTVTDAEGQSTEATLTIKVDRNNESGGGTTPSTLGIEWIDYDISQEYTLTADMQINILCTAPAGIRSLTVSIISETLDVTEAGLPASFDLANISDPELIGILGEGGFEFPINDKVKNQTEVPFSITPFVSLLMNFEGLHKFQLEMTDNNGQTVTETVQLRVIL